MAMLRKKHIRRLSWPEVKKKLGLRFRLLQVMANVVGIGICFSYFTFFDSARIGIESWQKDIGPVVVVSIFLIILGFGLLHCWIKDIRVYIEKKIAQQPIDQDLHDKVLKKILNLPAASALISFFNWGLATLIFLFLTVFFPIDVVSGEKLADLCLWISMGISGAGFITGIMVFFLTELLCRSVLGTFFPKGDLFEIKKVFRLSLLARILMIFLLASVFPLTDMAVVSYDKAKLMLTEDPETVLRSLLFLIFFLLAVEISIVVVLSLFMAKSIVSPILHLKRAMLDVEKGDFSVQVPVIDNNEIGELSQHFNIMTAGLKERYELKKSLALAEEVQQNLLPESIPEVPGLDIAGQILYCDQTGGDYFDLINAEISGMPSTVFVIGDVSGHGIPSALLMSSARAFLRQRLALAGSLDQVVNDINVQFCCDVGSTGRFMTLLVCAFDNQYKSIKWVRAGHEPALYYNPVKNKFTEMVQNGGIPLGVDDTFVYQKNEVPAGDFKSGQILFAGTDGIWESAGPSGERFGKERVKEIIRENKDASAQTILEKVLQGLDEFMDGMPNMDDVTLIVVKKK